MRNVIKTAGGVVIAAVAVIAIFSLYRGIVMPKLKAGAGAEGKGGEGAGAALEEAVLSDPVLIWRETSHIKAGEDYPVWDKILVQDSYDGYEKSLKEAVRKGKIRVQEMQVLDSEGKETGHVSADPASGIVRMERSGIYQVHIKGMDQHNNEVQESFLIAVNRKGDEE